MPYPGGASQQPGGPPRRDAGAPGGMPPRGPEQRGPEQRGPEQRGAEQRGGEIRRRDTDPTGRRAEAAFEDTQAMLAAQAGGGRSAGPRPGEGGRRRRGRGASGPAAGGPGGPEGPGGPGGHGPDDGDDEPQVKRWTRFLPNWKIVMASFVVLSAGVFGMIAVAYANTPIPLSTQASVDDRGSVIYYRDKKTPIARLGIQRTPVKLSQVPKHVQDAVIALENQTFRTDSGIDIAGMARSLWSTVSGTQLQGASTITQQMARGYYDGLSAEVSIQRKIKEIFVAVKISKTLEKDQILEEYFNLVYFGRNAYGIQAAAKAYFGKNVGELTVPEGAYLAGRIQNPTTFDNQEKAGNYAATKERFEAAIRNMAELDPAAYGKYAGSSFEDLKFEKVKVAQTFKGLKGYMLNIVFRELKARHIEQSELETEGYKVYTTFDKGMMEQAYKAVKARTSGLEPTIHARVASVDPKNGRVLAFYSGDDFVNDYNNRAFDSTKQAASAFKPYVLAAWLESGKSLDSLVDGMRTIKMPGTTPISNSGNAAFGPIDMVKAMASSVNTVFVQMGDEVKLEEVARIAKEAGVGETAKYDPRYQGKNAVDYAVAEQKYQVTIGSASVTAVEQAAGYGIFANEGKHFNWHTVTKVTKVDGTPVLDEQIHENQVITAESAADATVALQAVVRGGTGGAANIGTRPVAGKTGTNNGYKDAWFVGFTPQLVTAVGMSKDVPYNKAGTRKLKVDKYGLPNRKLDDSKILWKEEPMPSFIGGGGTPTQIWHDYMQAVTAKDEVLQFPPRANSGVRNNLATPSPTPTPTPTMDDTNPFPDENGDDGGWPNDNPDGGGETDQPEGRECLPWDGSCDVGNDGGGGDGGSGDEPPIGEIGQGGAPGAVGAPGTPAAALVPTPTASGRRP
ncbi:transglycosylase domain-containing protein [Streptosporangium sp. NBC_01469]|uniref:transglycosylase domain-containing protein n=1 Tax=Streptosporangium sp. NBC_01469 TaxID=2903898 RepID=UPI002E2A1177|nr:transglycosylase domain-containing protein [Streptosporangium sp. NBC_01469]